MVKIRKYLGQNYNDDTELSKHMDAAKVILNECTKHPSWEVSTRASE